MFNSLAPYKTEQEKKILHRCALIGGSYYALDESGNKHRLSDVPFDKVDFIGGIWRVQHEFNYPISVVRDKRFVIADKINRTEKNLFEYYHASSVFENCWGICSFLDNSYVVAKYDTDNGPLWAYGATLEQARAFLGIALLDKNIDIIHATERKEIMQNQK